MTARDLNSTKPCIFGSEEYAKEMLGLSGEDIINWGNFGGMQWELVGCLFVAWLAVYLSVFAGVRSTGKGPYTYDVLNTCTFLEPSPLVRIWKRVDTL